MKKVDLERVISSMKCCFKNPHHYTLAEQHNIVKQDVDAIRKKILEALPGEKEVNPKYIDMSEKNFTTESKEANALNFGYNIALEDVRRMIGDS